MIILAAYALGIGCIAIGSQHRLAAWSIVALTRSRLARLVEPMPQQRDVATTLSDLARALRSGLTLRTALIGDFEHRGSALPQTMHGRLLRGDVLRDLCREELVALDARLRRAIELADLAGTNGASVLDVAADSIRQDDGLALLAHSAGTHARSTMGVLTGCAVVAITVSGLASETVRHFLTSPLGVFLATVGVGCNVAGRAWIARETTRVTRADAASTDARDAILTLECLVLAGYSLQGALMTAHTWLNSKSAPLTRVAELLHAGHGVESALTDLEHSADPHLQPLVHGLRLAHHDGQAVHASLGALRNDITRREEHRLTTAIQRTPVRLVLPLVACGLPSFLCIGIVPVLVAIFGGLTSTNGV